MAIKINLEKYGHKKKGFVGFSYTTFFFGFLVPLFRGDAKRFVKFFFIWLATTLPILVVDNFPHQINNWNNQTIKNFIISLFDIKYKYVFLAQSLIVLTLCVIHMIVWYMIANNYNKKYTEQLLKKGYIPTENDDFTLTLLKEYGHLEYTEKDRSDKKKIELYNNIIATVKKEEKKKFYISVIAIFLFTFISINKISETYNKLGDISHFEYTQKYI